MREPRPGEPGEPRDLYVSDRLGRAHERTRVARLHLHEDVAAGVTADEVDLAPAGPRVARDRAQAAACELALGDALPRRPEGLPTVHDRGTAGTCVQAGAVTAGRARSGARAPRYTPMTMRAAPAMNCGETASPAKRMPIVTVTTGKRREAYDVADAVHRWRT